MARKKKKSLASAPDQAFQDALRKAYIERARLFVDGLKKRKIDVLIQRVSSQSPPTSWPLRPLGITSAAIVKVRKSGIEPHLVFCHPDVLQNAPDVFDYYRNLAALSNKGLGQIVTGLRGDAREATKIATVNQIISAIVDDLDTFDLALTQAIIPVEIGAELQGTWVNVIGQGAARKVKELIDDFVERHRLAKETTRVQVPVAKGRTTSQTHITLINGWTIIFAAEPDVAIRNMRGILRVAIEIKGSLDKAGAQTRYGEAKKSFAKALAENAQCETIYLASCFTDAVRDQIQRDMQVRQNFNLIEILADSEKRDEFLTEIFKHQIRII